MNNKMRETLNTTGLRKCCKSGDLTGETRILRESCESCENCESYDLSLTGARVQGQGGECRGSRSSHGRATARTEEPQHAWESAARMGKPQHALTSHSMGEPQHEWNSYSKYGRATSHEREPQHAWESQCTHGRAEKRM